MISGSISSPSDLVAAGVSGGADSVCLLHILRRLQKEIAFRLLAVHVDHGARLQHPLHTLRLDLSENPQRKIQRRQPVHQPPSFDITAGGARFHELTGPCVHIDVA